MSTSDLPLQVHIANAAELDLQTLSELINDAFNVHGYRSGPRTSSAGLARELGERGEMVAISDGDLTLACALIRPVDDMDTASDAFAGRFETALYFGLAAVRPERMGGGLGKRLLAEAEAIARRRGYSQVVLGTVDPGLVRYYESADYEVVAERAFPAGHWGISIEHSLCNMVKKL